MARHIAMVGTASSRISAPYHNTNVEIWGVSDRGKAPRADRWFEIHRIDGTFDKPGHADSWRDELKKFSADIPALYMIYPEPALHPNVVSGWHEKLVDRFGTYLMTSTFAWMMALAIEEMAPIDADGTRRFAPAGSKISIYGVDMEYGTEYRQQRQGFRSFIKVAEQLGIEVLRVTSGGLLYEPVPYPMWQDDPLLCKLEKRNKEAKATIADRQDSIRATRELIASTRGSLAEVKLMQNPITIPDDEDTVIPEYNPEDRIVQLEKQTADLLVTSAQISRDIVAWEAIDEEQNWLKDYLLP